MKNISKTVAFLMITVLLGLNLSNNQIKILNKTVVEAAEVPEESAGEIETSISDGETSSGNVSDEISSEDMSTDETTTPESETTTPEPETTTPEFIIIDGVYKVKDTVLVEYLGEKNDSAVTEIEIPAEITKISDYVFDGYKYIRAVKFEIGSQIKELGQFVFRNCSELEEINLPEGIVNLGYRAFAQCANLKKITIPSSVATGEQIVGKKGAITYVEFAKGTTTIPMNILRYAGTLEEVKMYSGVKTIGKRAFYQCKKLKTISLPDSIESIETSAFNECISIAKLTLPSSLKKIGDYAFKNCTALMVLKIKKTVKSIGVGAFAGDTNLTLQVYANSYGKGYALKYKLKWEYAPSEIKRQKKSLNIKTTYEKQISKYDKNKYKLKQLNNYIPQGICTIKNYLVVSMYHKNLKKKSILLVYNKKTGKYIKKIYLPSVDHVGSVTNVKNRLAIGLNNISSTDYVAVINYTKLKKIKNNKTIKYSYKVKIPGYADFAAFDGTYFWAGRSANISYASMYGYKVKVKKKKLTFTKKYSYTVPANTQGLIVIKGKGGKREFIISQSYGVIADSSIYTYSININRNQSLGTPISTKLAPSMIEGIVKNGNYVYVVFESAAGKYCSDDNYTTEIQMKNVTKIKYQNLKYLYDG